jgi:hypothetical protein
MSKTLLALSLLALMGSASAAERMTAGERPEFEISNEADFVVQHNGEFEKLAEGVYQVTSGPLAGKRFSFGEAGRSFDLAQLKSELAAQTISMTRQGKSAAEIEAATASTREMIAGIDSGDGNLAAQAKSSDGKSVCSGYGSVTATANVYQNNFYYGVANAKAVYYGGTNFEGRVSVCAQTRALNSDGSAMTTDYHCYFPLATQSFTWTAKQQVSGPLFCPKTDSFSSVSAVSGPNCIGYVGVSDKYNPCGI